MKIFKLFVLVFILIILSSCSINNPDNTSFPIKDNLPQIEKQTPMIYQNYVYVEVLNKYFNYTDLDGNSLNVLEVLIINNLNEFLNEQTPISNFLQTKSYFIVSDLYEPFIKIGDKIICQLNQTLTIYDSQNKIQIKAVDIRPTEKTILNCIDDRIHFEIDFKTKDKENFQILKTLTLRDNHYYMLLQSFVKEDYSVPKYIDYELYKIKVFGNIVPGSLSVLYCIDIDSTPTQYHLPIDAFKSILSLSQKAFKDGITLQGVDYYDFLDTNYLHNDVLSIGQADATDSNHNYKERKNVDFGLPVPTREEALNDYLHIRVKDIIDSTNGIFTATILHSYNDDLNIETEFNETFNNETIIIKMLPIFTDYAITGDELIIQACNLEYINVNGEKEYVFDLSASTNKAIHIIDNKMFPYLVGTSYYFDHVQPYWSETTSYTYYYEEISRVLFDKYRDVEYGYNGVSGYCYDHLFRYGDDVRLFVEILKMLKNKYDGEEPFVIFTSLEIREQLLASLK